MDPVTILLLLFKLAICGFIVWLIVTYIPMPDVFKQVIIGVAIIVLLWWLITTYGGRL